MEHAGRRVLHEVKTILLGAGYVVLLYNSRGVGKSSGWPSLTGIQEANDLQELVQWALTEVSNVTSVVVMASNCWSSQLSGVLKILQGYSYGSLITSLYPLLPENTKTTVSHILLSYPLGPRSWLTAFHGKHYATTLNALLSDSRSNLFVVYGDRDEFTSVESYDVWAESLREEAHAQGAGKLQIVKVEGANHFWNDETAGNTLLRNIQEWLL